MQEPVEAMPTLSVCFWYAYLVGFLRSAISVTPHIPKSRLCSSDCSCCLCVADVLYRSSSFGVNGRTMFCTFISPINVRSEVAAVIGVGVLQTNACTVSTSATGACRPDCRLHNTSDHGQQKQSAIACVAVDERA